MTAWSRSEDHDPQGSAPGSEPLAASWRPDPGPRHARPSRRGWLWLLLALPLLLIVSGLALLRAGEPRHHRPAAADQAPPLVQQPPANQSFPPETFSANLPPGGEIPATGDGSFSALPGSSPVVGSGRLQRYTVEVENGVRLPGGNDTFGELVQDTLSDPRSWTNPKAATPRGPLALQRVEAGGPRPDFRVTLVSQQTARQVCGYQRGLPVDTSCKVGDREYINAARWVRGAVAFEGDMGAYRHYAINHEVGHAFGLDHVGCPAPGALAPTMMQQTFGVSNDVLHDLNTEASQGTAIPRNGFTCRPSAWPFPTG